MGYGMDEEMWVFPPCDTCNEVDCEGCSYAYAYEVDDDERF